MKKLRVLISSNGHHTPSGYGSQLAELTPNLKKDTDLAVSAFYGLQGGEVTIDGVKTYPAIDGDPWNMQGMILHGKDFGADVVISNQDIWTWDPNWIKNVPNLIPWVPIDHNPVPKPILERLSLVYRIAVYTKFGKNELEKNGLYSTYVPMSVNTQVFRKRDKLAMRKKFGLPEDAFIFGMVAANRDNPSRKSFQESIDAFLIFLQKHPNSYFYAHTVIDAAGGFPIRDYFNFLGIQDRLLYKDHYDVLFKFPKERLAELMNTFDCLLNPSTNEGFGLPIIEAQSCGVPVIVNNFTSMPELIKNEETGFLCESDHLVWTPIQSYKAIPSIKSIYECMERVFKANREKMGKAGRKFMVNNFDTQMVYRDYWKPFIETLTEEFVKP